jgi:hypothetical protein
MSHSLARKKIFRQNDKSATYLQGGLFFSGGNLIFYTFGNFIGSLLLRNQDAPRYLMGMGGGWVILLLMSLLLVCLPMFVMIMFKKIRYVMQIKMLLLLPDGLEDITDDQNPHFAYRT